MLLTIIYQFLQYMAQAYQLGTKQQVSFSRLTQVSSLDLRTQFIYFMNIKLPDMDENQCQHLRTLAFSLDATTEDQVRFKQTINKMTTLRRKQLQGHKKNPNYEFQRRQTAIKTKTVEKIQPSFSTKIFGCFKHIVSSASGLMKEKQERPNTMATETIQEEKEQFLPNYNSETCRNSK